MAKLKLLFCSSFGDDQVREVCPSWQPDSYLVDYDPTIGVLNTLKCSLDPTEAKEFESAGEAMAFWSAVCAVDPIRPDGQPNRPLTVFTVAIE